MPAAVENSRPVESSNPSAARRFIPAALDVSDVGQLAPLYRQLLDRAIESTTDAEQWLTDFSELTAAVDEYGSRRYIDKSCHTDDAGIEQRFMQFVEQVEPQIKPLYFELQKKFLAAPVSSLLESKRYGILIRKWRADVELFRPENVALETEATKLTNEYDKLCAAMTVEFDGAERTLQQMARYGEQTDRSLRERAFRASAERRLQDRAAMDRTFDQLLDLRKKMATNAGLPDYRAVAWKAYKRFDYTPDQCLKFADAIEAVCVPVVKELDAKVGSADLKIDRAPAVGPVGGPAKPPAPGTVRGKRPVSALIDKTKAIFRPACRRSWRGEFESLRVK